MASIKEWLLVQGCLRLEALFFYDQSYNFYLLYQERGCPTAFAFAI